ncbi:MAG: ABC transporter permease subunit [Phycisphaerae bacterium]
MQAVLRDLGHWIWRLGPANPILVRVVSSGGKRLRHLWIRAGYLVLLAIAVVIGVIFTQLTGGASLAELAKHATVVFKVVSLLQLGMVCILAPVFAAAAITQEKDSQTYNILLATPLTNGQIVLGSLLSRLYFVFALLIAGIPLFCIMMVYGGVTGDKIALAISLAAATALLTGALAITISVVKIGTGKTIFSFYLAIAVYLIVVYSLARVPALMPPEAAPAPGAGPDERMSWLAAFHPFLALGVVLGQTPAPDFGAVAHYGFPGAHLLAYPQYSFLAMSVGVSALLMLVSLFFVRRSVKEGESSLLSKMLFFRGGGSMGARSVDERTRKPRRVSRNPIAWRESVTGAAASGGLLVRYLLIGTGLCLAVVLLVFHATGAIVVTQTRDWLYGIVMVELGIVLFVATTTAATSMTREKESNTLELLLATPLTSGKIITGKIRGLIHAAGPMLLVPYLTVAIFLAYDLFSGRLLDSAPGGPETVIHPEALLALPTLLVAFTAFACMVGLQASIKSRKTMGAVFGSMAVVIAVFVLTGSCAVMMQSTSSGEALTAAFMPLTPITAVHIIIDPKDAVGAAGAVSAATLTTCRVVAFVASICSAVIYGLIGLQLHRSMVRNFDMIIRKQTA